MGIFSAVLFDLDGTLIDAEEYIFSAFNYALKQQGFPLLIRKKHAHLAGIPLRKCYPVIAPNGDVEKFVSDHRQFQLKNMHLIKKYPEMKQVIEKTKKKGLMAGIVTSRYRASTELVLKKIGLNNLVDVLVSGDDFAESKPSPIPFLEAIKRIGKKPVECLVVGDGCADIIAGKAAGCITCRAVYGYGGKEECSAKEDYRINSLEEVLEIIELQL